MKRTAKIFVGLILLLAGSTFAQSGGEIRPIGFRCTTIAGSEVQCEISQAKNASTTFPSGYDGNIYNTWNAFVDKLGQEVGSTASTLQLTFKSDIDLGGGYLKSDKKCFAAFKPLAFHKNFDKTIIDGDGNTIKNFCNITIDENASFFGDFSSDEAIIKDLTFDNAYVMATVATVSTRTAAVVAEKAWNIEVANVKVTNSEVHGWNTAAIIGRVACNSVTHVCPVTHFSDVKVENVTFSLITEVLNQHSKFSAGNYSPWNGTESYSGALVGNLEGIAEFVRDTVWDLTTPDSISKIITDYYGESKVGGLVGYADGSSVTGQNKFSLQACVVKADLSGFDVGGLIGEVNSNGITEETDFEVSGANIILNSGDYNGTAPDFFVGGLVGKFNWKNGNVLFSKNSTNVTSKNEKEGAGAANAEIGGLVGNFYVMSTTAMNFVAEENIVESEVESSRQNPKVGGLFGYTSIWAPQSKLSLKKNKVVSAKFNTSGQYLYAGGLLGYIMWNADDGALSVDTNEINAEIKTSGTYLRLGGILGYSFFNTDNSINSTLSIRGTTVKPVLTSGDLIKTTGTNLNVVAAAQGVGYVQNENGSVEFLENRVQGDISVAATSVNQRSAVGAMIGEAFRVNLLEVVNNVSSSDLKTSIENGTAAQTSETFSIGYVVGHALVGDKVTIKDNFHYGSKDVNANLTVGFLHFSGTVISVQEMNKNYTTEYDVRYNYRNALKDNVSLLADGELNKNGSGEIIVDAETVPFWYNGVIDSDVMKSRLFTYVMNATQTSNTDPVKWESKQSSLPLISSKRTAYKLAISLSDADYNALSADDKTALKDYLPAKCEAGKCSLYVYTENDSKLKGDLSYDFELRNTAFMVVDVNGNIYNFSRTFTKDDKAKGLTDREIKVTYYLENPAQLSGGTPMPVSMDDYVDDVTFAWPKVEKVRLLSSKDIVPTALLDYNNAKYELVLYQAYTCPAGAAFFAGCKNVFASGISLAQKQMNNIEAVLKEVRTHINNNNGDEIQLYYKLVDLSEGISYMPRLDIGLFNSKAKINVTTYGYNKNDALDEIDSYELGNTQPLRSDVDMASKYGFNLAERGFKLDSLIVDFWLGLNETSTDVIKECYNEGSKTAKCAETNMYGDLSKNYFNSESDIENQLNATVTSGKSRLMKWSTKLDADEMLNLDSMAQAMSIVIPQMAAKAPMFMAVEPHLTGIPYKVAFDINAGGKNVFLTDEFVIKDSYSRENDEKAKLPEGLLATDACFTGWIENAENPALTPSIKMDGTLLEKANPKDAGAFDLYGAWDAGCTVEKAKVLLKVVDKTGAEVNYGTVTLSQSYRNPGKEKVILKHDFVDGRLEVPTSAEPITLHVASVQTNKEYDLAKLTLKKADGTELSIPLGSQDTSFKIAPAAGVTDTLYAMFGGYIDVDVKVGRNNVFYGYDSYKETLHLVDGGTTDLPMWVYTPTECVLGWSVTPDGADYDHGSVSSDVLSAKVTSEKTLYGVWGNADACVANADYRRLKLESDHGTVEIGEVDDGSVKMHSFAADSTMLLPLEFAHSKWVIHGVPQEGYKLDSVVIDGRIKLADGDVLADSITGYLPMKAYFSEKNTEEIKPVVSPDVDYSVTPHKVVLSGARNGNAMRLPIKWEVKPGVTVNLVVKLVDFLGVELPYPPLDTNVTGIDSCNWDVYPLLPGTYYIRGAINKVSAESIPLVVEPFTVKAEIAVAPNTWQMVSLSDVDQNAVLWDDDSRFYYWDESAEYGVAWKYQRYNGGAVKAQQGIWYNSQEGRALPLRRDVATGSNVQGAPQIVWELEKGWNMVANPYGWRVKLPENILNTFEICKWSAESGFAPVTELEPYEAVWLHSDTKTPIDFAAEPLFDNPVNTGALQKATLAKATREKWTLQAELRDTRGHGDSWNVLGVGAAEERLEPPAGMGDFVNLSVVEGKKALLKSIKSAEDDRHEWNLALSATTDRVGYLKFEGVKALNEIGLKVYVTIDGKTTEMGAGDSLKVLLKAAGSTATVQVTSSAVTTVASKIENLRFERVPGALQVGFDVSSDLAGAGYRVQLVSVNGKVAATYSAKSTAGHNTLALTAPKPGLYLLRVTLGRHHAVRKVAISR